MNQTAIRPLMKALNSTSEHAIASFVESKNED